MNTETLILEPKKETQSNELVRVINESGLEKTKAQILLDNFSNYFQIAADWENKTKALVIDSVEQKAEMKMAREGRLFLRSKRIDVEKTRKQLKESALREGQTIDAIAKILTNLIEPIENELEQKEKYAEIIAEQERQQRKADRESQLAPYDEFVPFGIDLSNMNEDDFQKLLSGSRLQYQAKIEASQKAEAERIAKEKAEAEERERIRIENERLKKEAEAKEKELAAQKAKAEKERKEAESKLAKEKAEHEAKLKAARDAQAKVEAELKAKKEAEERARKEAEAKEAAELKARQDAEKKAKAAPDKDKLTKLSKLIIDIELPEMKSDEGKAIMKNVNELLAKVSFYILDSVKKI
jgi:hypothetical protein